METARSSLVVLAYPDMAPDDLAWIERIRAEHDPLYGVVEPHFTLVFPVSDMAADALVADIKRQAHGVPPISFVLRSALPFPDEVGGGACVFLVPDEGFGNLVRLHDRLYADALASELRLDIPTIPHMTVGRAGDIWACKRLADELNAQPFAVVGWIGALEVAVLEGNVVRAIERIPLLTVM